MTDKEEILNFLMETIGEEGCGDILLFLSFNLFNFDTSGYDMVQGTWDINTGLSRYGLLITFRR